MLYQGSSCYVLRWAWHGVIYYFDCVTMYVIIASMCCGFVTTKDAFYDRGSPFPLKRCLNDGAPQTKIVGMPTLFRKMT